MTAKSGCQSAASFFERAIQTGMRGLDGRSGAEQKTCDNRQCSSEAKGSWVNLGFVQSRQIGRKQNDQRSQSPERQQHPARSADQTEQETLGPQLPQDLESTGSQSHSDR